MTAVIPAYVPPTAPAPSAPRPTRPRLLGAFRRLFERARGAFGQQRVFERAWDIALSIAIGLGRRTVTGMLCTAGRAFVDWSAAYRLFSQKRVEPPALFAVAVERAGECLSEHEPLRGGLDDTLLRHSGRKIPGTGWRRDPLGPRFRVQLAWAQRWLSVGVLVPASLPGPARMLPVALRHCPPVPKRPKKDAPEDVQQAYKTAAQQARLPHQGALALQELRGSMDRTPGLSHRMLHMAGDGGYTNGTLIQHLPERTVFIGRIRKDAALYAEPPPYAGKGRRRVYGERLATPEAYLNDPTTPEQTVRVYAAGQFHEMRVKDMGTVKWKSAGGDRMVRVVAIPALGYRKSRKSRVEYREPAYLVCTDPGLSLQEIVQHFIWRWEMEVTIREMKTVLGLGQAQVRHPESAVRVPQFVAAVYTLLHLAAHEVFGAKGEKEPVLELPVWRPEPKRPSTQTLMSRLREEVWGASMHFRDFVGNGTKCLKRPPQLHPAMLYAQQ
jgi:hypothetical protein